MNTATPRSHQPVVTLVPIDASSSVALHEQIYRALREAIQRGDARCLGPFFDAWGVPLSAQAKASIANLPRWMPEEMTMTPK